MTYQEFISNNSYDKYAICSYVDYLTRMCHAITCDSCPLYISTLMPKDCRIRRWTLTGDRIRLKHDIEKMFEFSYMDKVADMLGLSIDDSIIVNDNTYIVTKEGLMDISNNKLNKDVLSDILTGQVKFKRR